MAGNTDGLGVSGCTNFEGMSHQALYSMVADGDHMQLGLMGTALVDAGKEISRITHDLEAYVKEVQVHWKGEGAQAFEDWTRATAVESRKLGHYAKSTGEAMVDAAGALGQAKLMPRPPEPKNYVEVDSGKVSAFDALRKNPERDEAVSEMNRLASYYRTAQEKIAKQEEPNFRPASGFVPEPPPGDERIGNTFVLDRAANAGTVNAPGNTGVTSSAGGKGAQPHGTVPRSSDGDLQYDRHVGTSVDSTAPVTPPAEAPSHSSTVPHQPQGPDGPPAVPPGSTTFPGKTKAPGESGEAARSTQPSTGRRGAAPGERGRATGDGIVGGTAQRGRVSTGQPRLPGGTVMGEEHGVLGPRPGRSGAELPAAAGGRTRGDRGSVGQRLVPPRGEAMDRPRGPVMGEQQGSARGLTGHGIPGNAGNSIRQDVRGVPGRRLAYEPGGSVGPRSGAPVAGNEQPSGTPARSYGGSQSGTSPGVPATAGRSSEPEPGRTVGRTPTSRGRTSDFTPGGSGLTRTGTPSSNVLPMTGPSSQRRNGASGQRPAYLREDDETWTAQHPPAVPPVIE
ncbi:hypothetical protein [Streptomyces sp. NPDC058773]|uniref:hypothetical protein n=1 Tax=Streptomyces sp. NPDC058773 TaxID=3346632 RepID=UPI0036920D1C